MQGDTIGIILNGATGRICSTQHLARGLAAIRSAGGVQTDTGKLMPRLMLVGRNAERLEALAREHAPAEWTTDLDVALAREDFSVFFDASSNERRPEFLRRALDAGKHIFAEKPVVPSVHEGLELLKALHNSPLKHGVIEDKVYLPGLMKLSRLFEEKFFGRVSSFELEFGWWVFDGFEIPCQRSSWNYRRAEGGGLVRDMHPHWRYIIERLIGRIHSVVAATWTAIPERADESGARYTVDVEDNAATIVRLENGVVGTIRSSWSRRVRGDDLFTLRVDGSHGSAVAGLHKCHTQSIGDTPKVGWDTDTDHGTDYRKDWAKVAAAPVYKNSYRKCWEDFLGHVASGTPIRCDLSAGIRDVQFAEACRLSAAERRWVTLDELLPLKIHPMQERT